MKKFTTTCICYEIPMTAHDTLPHDGMHALQMALKRWELTEDGAAFQTATSVLQRVRLKEGPRAFVKVALDM